jgi:antitoxin MazE
LTADDEEPKLFPTSLILDVRPAEPTDAATGTAALVGERGTITIPSEIRRRHRLQPGSAVLIAEEGDAIVIRPAEITPRSAPSKNLETLLEGITPENLHGEWQTGPAVGQEEW